jgi:hypothetical protein
MLQVKKKTQKTNKQKKQNHPENEDCNFHYNKSKMKEYSFILINSLGRQNFTFPKSMCHDRIIIFRDFSWIFWLCLSYMIVLKTIVKTLIRVEMM